MDLATILTMESITLLRHIKMIRFLIMSTACILFSCSGIMQYKKCAKEYSIHLNRNLGGIHGAFLYADSSYYRERYNSLSFNGKYTGTDDIDTIDVLNCIMVFYPNGRCVGPIYFNSKKNISELIEMKSDLIYSFSSLGRYKTESDTVFVEFIYPYYIHAPFINYKMGKLKFIKKDDSTFDHEKIRLVHANTSFKEIKLLQEFHLLKDRAYSKLDMTFFWNFQFESKLSK